MSSRATDLVQAHILLYFTNFMITDTNVLFLVNYLPVAQQANKGTKNNLMAAKINGFTVTD